MTSRRKIQKKSKLSRKSMNNFEILVLIVFFFFSVFFSSNEFSFPVGFFCSHFSSFFICVITVWSLFSSLSIFTESCSFFFVFSYFLHFLFIFFSDISSESRLSLGSALSSGFSTLFTLSVFSSFLVCLQVPDFLLYSHCFACFFLLLFLFPVCL